MKFPCEIIGAEYLPLLRKHVAHMLKNQGLSQTKIAQRIGVSQPIVSGYLKEPLSESKTLLGEIIKNVAEQVTAHLIAERYEDAIEVVCNRCKALRNQGPICAVHREVLPWINQISPPCTSCLTKQIVSGEADERYATLQHFKSAVSLLVSRKGILPLIPEIGMQIAYMDSDSNNPEDVISFPGRIVRVKNSAKIVSDPEYGASFTLPSLLLWFRSNIDPKINGLIALRNISFVQRWVTDQGWKYITTQEFDLKKDEILQEILTRKDRNRIRLICDQGGMGLEAITYLFFEHLDSLFALIETLEQNSE